MFNVCVLRVCLCLHLLVCMCRTHACFRCGLWFRPSHSIVRDVRVGRNVPDYLSLCLRVCVHYFSSGKQIGAIRAGQEERRRTKGRQRQTRGRRGGSQGGGVGDCRGGKSRRRDRYFSPGVVRSRKSNVRREKSSCLPRRLIHQAPSTRVPRGALR